MNKTLYLFSLGLIILGALAILLLGGSAVLGPLLQLQVLSLLRVGLSLLTVILLTVFLGTRFMDVWRDRVDIRELPKRPIARKACLWGKWLLILYYLLLAACILSMAVFRQQLAGELQFMFAPLMQVLPLGLLFFELGHLLDSGGDH